VAAEKIIRPFLLANGEFHHRGRLRLMARMPPALECSPTRELLLEGGAPARSRLCRWARPRPTAHGAWLGRQQVPARRWAELDKCLGADPGQIVSTGERAV